MHYGTNLYAFNDLNSNWHWHRKCQYLECGQCKFIESHLSNCKTKFNSNLEYLLFFHLIHLTICMYSSILQFLTKIWTIYWKLFIYSTNQYSSIGTVSGPNLVSFNCTIFLQLSFKHQQLFYTHLLFWSEFLYINIFWFCLNE